MDSRIVPFSDTPFQPALFSFFATDSRSYTYYDQRGAAQTPTGGREIEELRAEIKELRVSISNGIKQMNNAPKSNGTFWKPCNAKGPFPDKMVRVGVSIEGETIFAGRAFHIGKTLLARVIPSRNAAYVCLDGNELEKENFEVLVQGEFVWQDASKGQVPRNAVNFVTSVDTEPVYMGRTLHSGSLTPGKVHQSDGCLYIPFGGTEISFEDYEVLCSK